MKRGVLSKVGLETVEDLLFYIPFRYENYLVSKIGIMQLGEQATIQGDVVSTANIFLKGGRSIQKITAQDDTGRIDAIFFNQKFILSNIRKNDYVSFAGRVEKFGSKKVLSVRSYEVLSSKDSEAIHTTGLVPVYPETRGLFSKWIRNRIKYVLSNVHIEEYLPEAVRSQNNLVDFSTALHNIHFPKNLREAQTARIRLSFDELLIKHTAALIRKKDWEKKQKATPFKIEKHGTEIARLLKSLPFELTAAQKKAINEVMSDLSKDIPMNRLLEGDVGSGKTVVAAIAAYAAFLNGYQTAFMAPTEILANQHFNTFRTILEPFGVKVKLFTTSSKKHEARIKKQENTHDSEFMIHDSIFDIAIGTHALIQKQIKFKKLGLVIIDEQQRFGVEQRAILREKGVNPHLLSMTATPIPRTIFLTIYSDLSLSVLDEMPKGRRRVKTWVVPEEKREGGYKWISNKIRTEKSQVFIVCPFIEPSETLTTVKAAKDEFERLRRNVFPNFKLGLLHGKLKSAEKNSVIEKFRRGAIDILVATPVIEVGIDIPTADIMIVEAAERFGLAQLHQLRGRIGRGEKQSYCFLFTDAKSEKTLDRLKYLQAIDNGPQLAEIDLKLRGPGDMFGTAQHGIPDLKIASLSDLPTIERARQTAEQLFGHLSKYPALQEKVEKTDIPKISRD
jgi:ATP-dependent DNA helicase RecG